MDNLDNLIKVTQLIVAFMIVPGIGAFWRINNAISDLKSDLLRLELKISENYVKKDKFGQV